MLRLRALVGIALGLLAALAPAQERLRDVVYGHKMGVALTMDVFKPAKPNGIGVIYMVSGGWFSSHDNIPVQQAKIFTDRGETVFAVVHGSQPKFQIPEILSDVNRAVRFIRTNAAKYGVSPNCLGVMGTSAGGHLSLMLGAFGKPGDPDAKDEVERASSRPDAVVAFFPPTDMMNWGAQGIRPFKSPMMRPFWPAFGVNESTSTEVLERMALEYSPIYGFTAQMPPTLFVHGDKDPLVPLQQSQIAWEKLKSLGVPTNLIVKAGGFHGWADMKPEMLKGAEWFEKHLK